MPAGPRTLLTIGALRMLACALLAVVAVATSRASHAQLVPSETTAYELRTLMRDLGRAGVAIPRVAVLGEYERYLAEWGKAQAESEAQRARALHRSQRSYPTEREVVDALEAYRQATKQAEAMEERLFAALIAAAPATEQPKIAAAREARAADRVEVSVSELARRLHARMVDVSALALRTVPARESRDALRAALAKTAAERLAAARALQEAQIKALTAIGAAADASGLAGVDLTAAIEEAALRDDASSSASAADAAETGAASEAAGDEEGEGNAATQQLMERMRSLNTRASAIVWKPNMALCKAQWKALEDCADLLPPARARRLVCDAVNVMLPELHQWNSREDELSRMFAWKRAPEGCREKLRSAALQWVAAEATLVRNAAQKLLAHLPTLEGPEEHSSDETNRIAEELSAKRDKAWDEFIKQLGPCIPPESDEAVARLYREYEEAVAAGKDPPAPTGEQLDAASEFRDGPDADAYELLGCALPETEDEADDGAPREDDAVRSFHSAGALPSRALLVERLRAFGVGDDAIEVAEQVRADAMIEWDERVTKALEPASAYENPWFNMREAPSDADAEIARVEGALRSGESEARRVLERFAESTVAAVGPALSVESAELLRMDLRLANGPSFHGAQGMVDSQANGGALFNPAQALAVAALMPADRTAAIAALAAEMHGLQQGAEALQRFYVEYCLSQVRAALAPQPEGASKAQMWAIWREHNERRESSLQALAAEVAQQRRRCEAAIDHLCGAVSAEGAPKLRESAERRMFPDAWQNELDAAGIAAEVTAALQPGDPAIAEVSNALARFRAHAAPLRSRAIQVCKAARGRPMMSWRKQRPLEDMVRIVQEQDIAFQNEQVFAMFAERVRAAVPRQVARASHFLRNLDNAQQANFE